MDLEIRRVEVEAETSLMRAMYLDSRTELSAQTKRLPGVLDRATAAKLLHLCCSFDSAECAAALLGGEVGEVPLVNELDEAGKSPLHTAAEYHAWRCVEVLLEKHARTDLSTNDGQAQLALELSLSDTSLDLNRNPKDLSVEDLVIHMTEKDLSTVKLLSEKTKEVAEVAYACAVKGRVAALTALLTVGAEKVIDSVLEFRDSISGRKVNMTIYECLIREALALGSRSTPQFRAANCASTATEEKNISEISKLLLRAIELFQHFGAVALSGGGRKKKNKKKKEKKVTSPLISAAMESQKLKEGADQSLAKLLKHKIFVGGLPPSANSDDLHKFCEEEFGSVEEAKVIVTQSKYKIQSRGFGFVTFRQEKSAADAMQARYVTMRGNRVEIKRLIPKLVLGAEFEKMSLQQRVQDRSFPLLQQKALNIMEGGDNPERGSWADRLVLGQSTASSTESQVLTKSSEDPNNPTWLKVFKKWFPGFIKGLPKHPNYALSSLKSDFRAKFGVELDHSSLGYSKLSDFLKCFSHFCTIETLPICKGRTPTPVQLTRGADPEFLNLCEQRATDLAPATTQDMRYILENPTTVSLSKYFDSSPKGEIRKYFDSHRGCAGGATCFYAHCEEEVHGSNTRPLGLQAERTVPYHYTNPLGLAMFCEDGVITSWDSRTCASEYIRNDNSPDKMFQLDKNQICVTAGDVNALREMEESVLKKVQKRLNKQKPLSVLDSASYVFKALVGKPAECMIIGYIEELEKYQIWHAHAFPPVALTLVDECQACGSGKSFIEILLKSCYEPNISIAEAIKVHVCCLLEAGCFDPYTGGYIKVYHFVKGKCKRLYCEDALTAYSEYYDFLGDISVLFMFVPKDCYPLHVEEYSAFFRKSFDIKIVAAHAVTIKEHFSFHRLVLSSENDLKKIYKDVKNIGYMKKRRTYVLNRTESPYIDRFQNGLFYSSDHPLYIEESSLELLDEIRSMH